MLDPEIQVMPEGRFAELAARRIADAIERAVEARGGCRLALAGGSTPEPVYRALAAIEGVPFAAVDVFFGDERAVPPDDSASNYGMARRALLDGLAVPPRAVHRIEGERGAPDAARAYAEVLGDTPLDVTLLGMGGDGHTASIFPGAETPREGPRVIATTSPSPPHSRVSLSLGAINESRSVYFLVAGARKAARLAQVRSQIGRGEGALPAARVVPASGRLVWLLDRAAADGIEMTRGTR